VNKAPGFAAIGHSLGGHNSIFTAVFDSRIKVVVSSCGFDSFVDYYGGNLKGWTQERYMPRMADYLGRPQDVPFDFYELIAALGNRRVFVNAPLRDANFKHDSVDRIAAAAKPVFKLLGGTLTVVHPDSEHDFPDEARLELLSCDRIRSQAATINESAGLVPGLRFANESAFRSSEARPTSPRPRSRCHRDDDHRRRRHDPNSRSLPPRSRSLSRSLPRPPPPPPPPPESR